MAREKKSLFDWLTGSAGADQDYSFDDLESGSFAPATPPKGGGKPGSSSLVPEEPVDGELSVDVYETSTHIIIKAMIAGVKPEDLDITITRDMVTIRGKREQHTESQSNEFFFQELYWGSFSRTIVLPQEIEVEEAEAVEKHGLLVVRLPKLDKSRQAKLKVRAG
jgi:HSP20 family protein